MVTFYDSSIKDHILDRGLHIDDARGIDSDQVISLDRMIDGCRTAKSTKIRQRSLWYYKHF